MISPKTRILLVDDSSLYRECLRYELEEDFGFAIVGEASTGPEAIDLARSHQPDVVLLDLGLPGSSGYGAIEQIASELPRIKIVGLSMSARDEVEPAVLRAGAHAFVEKDQPIDELVEQIQALTPR